ncbi:MAG: 1-acyl-sn-glycerol-3-phosphate acyltransferase [Clostridia bacterium]|nr:1-acyl-sn-glycerol-3-phosphate acyltransferase [Clostridia bacterium]
MRNKKKKKAERLEILKRIELNEKAGGENFFTDVENDPPYTTLMPDDVDYNAVKFSTKIKRKTAMTIAKIWAKKVVREHKITVVGGENIKCLTGGAVVTSNHFSIFENVAVWEAVKKADEGKVKRGFYKIVREGNYFMPGLIGFLLRYGNTLPLSSNVKTMMNLSRTVDDLLKKGNFVLVYPEKALWWNYKKPRPYKIGAYHYAVKAGVPVVPCFCTMKDGEKQDESGFPVQEYTVHVGKPIYPDDRLPVKEREKDMLDKNFAFSKEVYEKTYGVMLSYTCN